jgi:hypothetical protein
MEAYRLLLKSYWSVSEIASYYQVSHNTANNIKIDVERIYGTPCYCADKERTTVKADDVISFMGGTNRLEEMQLIKIATEIDKLREE